MANNKLILRTLNSGFPTPFQDTTLGSVLSHADLDNNFIYLKSEIIYTATTSGTVVSFDKIGGNNFDLDLGPLIDSTDNYTTGGTLVGEVAYFDRSDQLSAYTLDLSTLTFTGNTSGDCISDLHVSNIHSCSPLNINPNDEGNVFVGSSSAFTFDLTNKRLGIGTGTTTSGPYGFNTSKVTIKNNNNHGLHVIDTGSQGWPFGSNISVTNKSSASSTVGIVSDMQSTDGIGYQYGVVGKAYSAGENKISYGVMGIVGSSTFGMGAAGFGEAGVVGQTLGGNGGNSASFLAYIQGTQSNVYGLYINPLTNTTGTCYNIRVNDEALGNASSTHYGASILLSQSVLNNYGVVIDVRNATNNNLALQTLNGNVVFNDSGANWDFRVEGDTDQNLLFVDASTDRVGIGTNTPSEKLHISGNTKINGTLNIGSFGTGTSINTLAIDSNGFVVTGATAVGVGKYAASVPMTGSTFQTVTHSLGTADVTVQLKDSTGKMIIPDEINNYTSNTVDIKVSSTETYRVIIIG